MELKVLLADDEPGILVYLEKILSSVPEVIVVGKALTIKETIHKALLLSPNVLFSDIKFPDGLGINAVQELLPVLPNLKVVFVTAHSDFMPEAFRLYSYDYILKPIDENRVLRTICRIKQSVPESSGTGDHDSCLRFPLKYGSDILLLEPAAILFLEHKLRKTIIHFINKTYSVSEPLSYFEQKLGKRFFRAHKSYLINLDRVEKITAWNENCYQIHFCDSQKEALLSRRRYRELTERLH
jgi:two-component system, LytTR family, response regulator